MQGIEYYLNHLGLAIPASRGGINNKVFNTELLHKIESDMRP